MIVYYWDLENVPTSHQDIATSWCLHYSVLCSPIIELVFVCDFITTAPLCECSPGANVGDFARCGTFWFRCVFQNAAVKNIPIWPWNAMDQCDQ